MKMRFHYVSKLPDEDYADKWDWKGLLSIRWNTKTETVMDYLRKCCRAH